MRLRYPLLGAAALMYGALQWLGRTWGATPEERRMTMPGDDIVGRATMSTTHAVDIAAPRRAVWPWLVQMGWHQGGWYTAPWVDRLLFPANGPAADRILPELQGRAVGDFVPDGPPESECGFVIERLVREAHLVLHSTSHLPLSWRRELGAQLDWTWSFLLVDAGDDRSRLVFRVRGAARPWWVLLAYEAVIVPADFVMSRQMMNGIAARAQRLRDELDVAPAA
jgi:hypothetical protein